MNTAACFWARNLQEVKVGGVDALPIADPVVGPPVRDGLKCDRDLDSITAEGVRVHRLLGGDPARATAGGDPGLVVLHKGRGHERSHVAVVTQRLHRGLEAHGCDAFLGILKHAVLARQIRQEGQIPIVVVLVRPHGGAHAVGDKIGDERGRFVWRFRHEERLSGERKSLARKLTGIAVVVDAV